MILYVFALLALTALAAADSSVIQWNDFTNNFATDIAPIITLFGEQVTKQFLSESTSFLDNIIFGVAPLGIITAVVSVIRVYGKASLKSFIGRAQEAHGMAEAELCSSTSEDVCELWSNGGICRVFGRPKILEFFYTQGGKFYSKFEEDKSIDEVPQPSCGIDLPRELLPAKKGGTESGLAKESETSSNWKEINLRGSQGSEHNQEGSGVDFRLEDDLEEREALERFARYPNLFLNIGMRPVPNWILWATAVFGISLQMSFFVYATWASFYTKALYDDGGSPQLWSFWLAVSGTALLVIGMTLCARLIERKSCERSFVDVNCDDPSSPKSVMSWVYAMFTKQESSKGTSTKEACDDISPARTVIFWLQPGGQRVGDQLFNAFAYSEEKHSYVTSWRVDRASGKNPDFIRYPSVFFWIAITSSVLGFVCQFVGLRGLHGSVALYQLASTLCMAIIRALLRSRRLEAHENRLGQLHRDVEGHELDWQALQIESSCNEAHDKVQSGSRSNTTTSVDDSKDARESRWYIVDCPYPLEDPDSDKESSEKDNNVHIIGRDNETRRLIIGFRPSSDQNSTSTEARCANSAVKWIRHNEEHNAKHRIHPNGAARLENSASAEARCANPAVEWIRHNERHNEKPNKKPNEKHRSYPNKAAKLMRFRTRLACLTDEPITLTEQGWDTEVRKMAEQLQEALQESAEYIFSSNMLSGAWKDARALIWSTTCQLSKPSGNDDGLPIHFFMYRSNNGRWKISKYQLEAVLGLWWWSLKQLPQPKDLFTEKVMLVEESKKMDFESAIHFWVTQTYAVKERVDPILRSMLTSSPRSALSVSTKALLRLQPPKVDEARTRMGNTVLLTIETKSSPLQMIAQDVFTIFISRIADVIEPLGNPALRQSQIATMKSLGRSQDRLYSGLINIHIESITDKLVAAGIGSRQDALMSIIPPLFQRSKLPQLEDVFEDLLSQAKSLKRNSKFQVGEDLLKGLFHQGAPEMQERVVRALGELYRAAIRSKNPLERDFGSRSLGSMEKRYNILELSDEAKKTLDRYKSVWQYFKGKETSSPAGRYHLAIDSKLEKLLEDLMGEPARTRSLTLTEDIDLSKESSADQLKILRWAIKKNCPELVEDLWAVERRLIHKTDSKGRTPVFWAIDGNCDTDTFQSLVEWPTVRLDSADTEGKTPLLFGAEKGHCKAVELLLKQEVDKMAKDVKGRTALSFACEKGCYDAVKRLLDAQVEANVQDNEYGSALAAAVYGGETKIVKLLVQEGKADVNLQFKGAQYGSALEVAVHWVQTEMVKFLVQEGKADVNMQLMSGGYGSVLAVAAHWGLNKIAEFLVQEGKADVNMQLKRGEYGSALEAAAYGGYTKMVKFLVQEGNADVNMQLKRGKYGSALEAAVYGGETKIVKFLVQEGKADVNVQFKGGQYGSALEAAVYRGHTEIVKFLVQEGKADVNVQFKGGQCGSALEAAVYRGHTEMVKFLVQEGKADVNVQFKGAQYGSALEAAVYRGHTEIAKFLVQEGKADVNMQLERGNMIMPL